MASKKKTKKKAKKRITLAGLLDLLDSLGACAEARRWIERLNMSPHKVWANCVDPDWMFWLLSELELSDKLKARLNCTMLRVALNNRLVPKEKAFLKEALVKVEAWACSPRKGSRPVYKWINERNKGRAGPLPPLWSLITGCVWGTELCDSFTDFEFACRNSSNGGRKAVYRKLAAAVRRTLKPAELTPLLIRKCMDHRIDWAQVFVD